jgi:TRAP-type mannitol/chloroaromatic compound transport system permease small subunit
VHPLAGDSSDGHVAVLTMTVLWGVFTRFCLGKQAEYTDELARVLLVLVSMVGAALAFGEKAHLGVDYFVSKLHPKPGKRSASWCRRSRRLWRWSCSWRRMGAGPRR